MGKIKKVVFLVFVIAGLVLFADPVKADMQRGDCGEDVGDLQQMLFDTGFLFDEIDGVFGGVTEQAVKNYQEFARLPVTGIVDEYTWWALTETWYQCMDEMYSQEYEECEQLFLDEFIGAPVEYGSGVYGNGTFTDAYVYQAMVGVTFGRLAFGAEKSEAGMVIAQETGADPAEVIQIEDGFLNGYPAYRLEYRIGGNEDTQECRDKVIIDEAEGVLHWFHCEIPADWFWDYEETVEEWMDRLYFASGSKEFPLATRIMTGIEIVSETDPREEAASESWTDTAPAGYEQVYEGILEVYRAQIYGYAGESEEMQIASGVIEAIAGGSAAGYLGYSIQDISGDGVPELLIGVLADGDASDAYGNEIYAAYTCINEVPRLIFEGWARNTYWYMGGGDFLYQGSGGALYSIFGTYSFALDGSTLLCNDYYFTYEKGESFSKIGFYHNTVGEMDKSVSEELIVSAEEFWNKKTELEGNVQNLELIPF